ncbi:MAG: 30S ribosomal protein S5 [Candidatus Uhrbacteria bacterium]
MAEEKKTINKSDGKGRGKPRGKGRRMKREPKEFEQKILDLSRVTRVTAGGKRLRFRACLVIGDQKGRVGLGLAKGADVAIAVDKAFRQAKKNIVEIPFIDGTIPHAINMKYGAAKILLKPAPRGTGLKAGGAVRVLLELAGVQNAVSKILGSSNKINIAKATMEALRELRVPEGAATDKQKTEKENKKTKKQENKQEQKTDAK